MKGNNMDQDELAHRVREAEARGRLTGLHLAAALRNRDSLSVPIPLSQEERVALGALKLLVERGVIRNEAAS